MQLCHALEHHEKIFPFQIVIIIVNANIMLGTNLFMTWLLFVIFMVSVSIIHLTRLNFLK